MRAVRQGGQKTCLEVKRGQGKDELSGYIKPPVSCYFVHHITEYINDFLYGIDTRTPFLGVQSLDSLRVLGDREGANPYVPTPFGTLKRIMRHLPVDHSQYTFIDYGSGKGRVILAAVRYPFREIIGIEFAKELHCMAERNISSFRGERCSPVHSVLCDAKTFKLRSDHVSYISLILLKAH